MSVKAVKGGYVIDFTLGHQRYRETIPAPHNKAALKRIEEQETVYKFAISMNDKSIADRFPNSKIIQKAFDTGCNYTIDDYSSIWFKQKQRNWSHTTIRGYSQKYNSYIKPNWGHLLLTEFKASMFDEWASECLLSGKSINEVRNVLNQIYIRAFYDEAIDNNPALRIERYKQKHMEPEPFSIDEINRILDVLREPYTSFYEVAFFTGLRVGELIGLRWEDLELSKGVGHVRTNITAGREKPPKTNGSIRTIELHPRALAALIKHKKSEHTGNRRVFIDQKSKTDYRNGDSLRKYVWKPAVEKAGIKYRYPYQCRHTYASMMLSQGENPMWVAKQMGHSDWGMIRKVYGRWIQ